jgi:hypothetical protein
MTKTITPEHILVDHTEVRRMGHWTTELSYEVRVRNGAAILDLRSHLIPPGDIEIRVNLDHGTLKLLVPDGATIDSWDLSFPRRGRVKDLQRSEARADGRVIRLVGVANQAEVRINRGGIAVLSAMLTKEFLADARRAHREGTTPVVADPSHV